MYDAKVSEIVETITTSILVLKMGSERVKAIGTIRRLILVHGVERVLPVDDGIIRAILWIAASRQHIS